MLIDQWQSSSEGVILFVYSVNPSFDSGLESYYSISVNQLIFTAIVVNIVDGFSFFLIPCTPME